MTLNETLQIAAKRLSAASDSATLDAQTILAWVLRKPRSFVFAHSNEQLGDEQREQFALAIERRADGEPVAYIVGEKEFWSLPVKVTAATLVPRPETELLVELTLDCIPADKALRILDLGTGSGSIALAIASERPRCSVHGIDICAAAVAVAAENASRLSLHNCEFKVGHWTDPVAGELFDIIVSNPPYIHPAAHELKTLSHEPQIALLGGRDGLDPIRHIARMAGTCLVQGGRLLLEHGADQADPVQAILRGHGWSGIRCHPDLAGRPRVTVAAVNI